jgi:two-component system, chemotaxis family, chemotaxis protein CheY
MSVLPISVLIVDDNKHMRTIVRTMLQGIGVRWIYEAADGLEAFSLMLSQAVDLVVTDLSMPRLNGIELIRKIRDERASPNPYIPIIVLSGHSSRAHVLEARDVGGNEFLAKPVTSHGLVQRLIALVNAPRPFVRAHGYFGPCRRRHDDAEYTGELRRAGERPQDIAQEARVA